MKRFLIIAVVAFLIAIMAALTFTPSDPPTPEPISEPIPIPTIITSTVMADNPTVCEFLSVEVEFTNSIGNIVDHVNYDIKAIQNGVEIISDESSHRHPGKHPVHQSTVLLGVMPIDITVTMQGLGHGDEITGPIGNVTATSFSPEHKISVDCEELHVTEDILPQ